MVMASFLFQKSLVKMISMCLIWLPFMKVGDPKQLPATVLSNIASKFLFECSMFERLQRAGHPVIMLTEQVMYPWITF